ncbi:U-box domain-containing protein 45-like [Bidens hawaiensis]|uniref:U-box domain-containing protein 45-like n=1 Tax=Bidens hawaiensis TaxID=980011 RepID=UPI004048EFFE
MRCGCGCGRKTIKSPECRSDTIKRNGSLNTIKSPEEKITAVEEAVKWLRGGGVLRGAKEVRELAKADSKARTKLALLGAIPPLVAMLETEDLDSQISALYALLNIGIGNDENKSAIVEAGVVHKMLKLVESPSSPNPDLTAVIIANFLGLSALDSNKSIIGSSGAISFLIKTLKSLIEANTGDISSQVIQDCLRALYNLSILVTNVSLMVEVNGFVTFLLTTVGGDTEISDRILSILTNVVSTPEGRHVVSSVDDVFTILVDVLSWMDSPSCQEKAIYVLMVMAYKSSEDQQAMIAVGIMSSLLELTLLGSALAQKRSSRTLEILRDKKGKQVSENSGGGGGATLSAPLCGSGDDADSLDSPNGFSSKNAVKHLVEQSLHNNMRKIVKRANLRQEFLSVERYKSSVASFSSSKSLPF